MLRVTKWVGLVSLVACSTGGQPEVRRPAGSEARLEANLPLWRPALPRLYPRLSARDLAVKATAMRNEFSFFRGYAPLFYDQLAHDERHGEAFASLRAFTGWLHGDLHPENFSTAVMRDGQARFVVNDLDDAGEGPLYLDPLRLFAASRFVEQAPGVGKLLRAYLEALRGDDAAEAMAVRRMRTKAEERGFALSKNIYDKTSGRLIRDEVRLDLRDRGTELALRAAVRRSFGERAQVEDLVEYDRSTGGSGFQKRYVALIRVGPASLDWSDEGRVVVEFKEMVTPATRWFGVEAPPVGRRVERFLKVFLGPEATSPYYATTSFGERDYVLRPRYEGEKSVDLGDWEEADLKELMLDEARLIGRVQREQLGSSRAAQMARAAEALGEEVWKDEARYLHELFNEIYAQSRP
jgi:hypothetical protein